MIFTQMMIFNMHWASLSGAAINRPVAQMMPGAKSPARINDDTGQARSLICIEPGRHYLEVEADSYRFEEWFPIRLPVFLLTLDQFKKLDSTSITWNGCIEIVMKGLKRSWILFWEISKSFISIFSDSLFGSKGSVFETKPIPKFFPFEFDSTAKAPVIILLWASWGVFR